MSAPDVGIVGAGIAGCAAAAFLAEAGARVRVYERERVAAAASGRNSGVLQHPLDTSLAPLAAESLAEHARTAPGLGLDGPPAGILVVSPDPAAVRRDAAETGAAFPELAPEAIDDAHGLEPAIAPGLAACLLATGHPVPPAAVTEAWAARARAGARRSRRAPARASRFATARRAG